MWVHIKHVYKQVALATAGSQLNTGTIKGMMIYVAGGETPAPWIARGFARGPGLALNPAPLNSPSSRPKGFAIMR